MFTRIPTESLHSLKCWGVIDLARPQKDGLEYFPHDVYAASDPKIEPILLLYGAKGYAFYFLHLEYIYRSNSLEFDISDAETREVIAQKLHISAEEYERILQTSLKKNLFDKTYYDDTHKLTSNGVKKRASSVFEKRDKMRLAYEQRISAAETTHIKESKEKKSKVKESNILGKFIPPTIEQVKTYCTERKNQVDAEKWIDFYTSKNWMIGKNKMKDWKAAVRTWEHNNISQQQSKTPQKGNFDQRKYDDDYFDNLEKKV